MKQQAYQHRSERSFDVGDWVFLRLQPYKQMSLKKAKKDNKLSPKYYGSYKVLKNIGIFSSTPNLPCFMLKKGYRGQTSSLNNFPELDEEGKTILEPEAVTEIGN